MKPAESLETGNPGEKCAWTSAAATQARTSPEVADLKMKTRPGVFPKRDWTLEYQPEGHTARSGTTCNQQRTREERAGAGGRQWTSSRFRIYASPLIPSDQNKCSFKRKFISCHVTTGNFRDRRWQTDFILSHPSFSQEKRNLSCFVSQLNFEFQKSFLEKDKTPHCISSKIVEWNSGFYRWDNIFKKSTWFSDSCVFMGS